MGQLKLGCGCHSTNAPEESTSSLRMKVSYQQSLIISCSMRKVEEKRRKDADVAAEIILTEVIPLISQKLLPATPPRDTSPRVLINLEEESEEEGNKLEHHQLVEHADVASSSLRFIPVEIIKAADSSSGSDLNVALNESMLSNASDMISKKLLPVTPPQDITVKLHCLC